MAELSAAGGEVWQVEDRAILGSYLPEGFCSEKRFVDIWSDFNWGRQFGELESGDGKNDSAAYFVGNITQTLQGLITHKWKLLQNFSLNKGKLIHLQ